MILLSTNASSRCAMGCAVGGEPISPAQWFSVARVVTGNCIWWMPGPYPQPDYGAAVTRVKRRFEQEVRDRRAEREHTLALTQAQQYILAELRMAYADASDTDNTRPQIAILEQAFRQPINRASLQKALRTLRSQRLTGATLVAALTELYHLHGLDMLRDRSASQSLAEDDDAPRVVCSEGLTV